jgi:hypothetical protein
MRPWIIAAVTTTEQQGLTTLLARWEALSCLVPALCPVAVEEQPLTSLRGGAIDVPSV